MRATSTRTETITATVPPSGRPSGTILATAGAAGTALALLVSIAADPGSLPFVAPPLLVALVVTVFAWRFGTWSKVLAVVWGLVALAQVPATPILAGLSRPDSLFDFVPGWLLVLSAITCVAGGALGVARRGDPGDGALATRWLATVGAVAAVLVAVSGLASIASDSALTEAERAGAVQITMTDGAFEPETLDLGTGEVHFALRNDGNVLHTFTVDELGIDETLSPGQEVLVTGTISGDADGVIFYCRPHSEVSDDGREGMTGRISLS